MNLYQLAQAIKPYTPPQDIILAFDSFSPQELMIYPKLLEFATHLNYLRNMR